METILELAIMEHDPDLEIVERVNEGDGTAFDVLYERHRQFIFNVCYRMLGSSDDAVDATQSTFIQAYRSFHSFRGGSAFRTWLCRIAINISSKMIRQQISRRQRHRELSQHAGQLPTEASTDRVWEAMLELPADMRAVLVLFYFHNMTTGEIAESIGASGPAVRTRLHRARAAFKKKYEELAK